MASIFQGTVDSPTPFPFKMASVRNPAGKIMLAEEQSSHLRDESSDPNSTTQDIINDGRWVANGDLLTIRHSKKGDVAFADGHVVPVTVKFGEDDANSRPDR
jgi:prepilin-type processing-associated H-X9-DG protein